DAQKTILSTFFDNADLISSIAWKTGEGGLCVSGTTVEDLVHNVSLEKDLLNYGQYKLNNKFQLMEMSVCSGRWLSIYYYISVCSGRWLHYNQYISVCSGRCLRYNTDM
ncbi:hypothetical protein MKW98_006035, partial [Papaver atlanticum]